MGDIFELIMLKRKSELERNGLNNNTRIISVEFLGIGNNTKNEYYRLIENKKVGELTETWEILYRVDKEKSKIIKVGSINTQSQGYMVKGDEKGDLAHCIEEREKQLEQIANQLGIKKEEIENLSEIELSQKLEAKTEKKESGELKSNEIENNILPGLNEISLNTVINNSGTTLGETLNMNDEYKKLYVVHSYKLANLLSNGKNDSEINNTKFGLVAQKQDGTYERVPQSKLSLYRGENREVTNIKNSGDVEVSNQDCIFCVPGTDKRIIISQNGAFDIPQVSYAKNTTDNDGQIAETLPGVKDGTSRIDIESRVLFNVNRGIYEANASIAEARQSDKKNLTVENVDGKPNEGKYKYYNPDCAEHLSAIFQIMSRGKVSKNEAIKKFERSFEIHFANSKGKVDYEIIINDALEEIESEFRNPMGSHTA